MNIKKIKIKYLAHVDKYLTLKYNKYKYQTSLGIKIYSPDNSPDEASPGELTRPPESIGQMLPKERLIFVMQSL